MNIVFRALRQEYLNLDFTTAGVRVEVVERPGRWMSEDQLRALGADLRQVARATLATGALDYGVFSGDPDRLANSTITIVREPESGRPVAFNALAHMDTSPGRTPVEVTHLGLVMVDPAAQSRGLSWILYGLTCLLHFLRGGLRACYISNVTQVPAVVGMVSETFSEVEPTPERRTPQDFRKKLIAREIMAHHRHVFGVGPDADFDDARFVIRNAYTGGSDDLKKTFDAVAKHRDGRFNDWCAETLDYARGDDVLQIGILDLAAAKRYVLRNVPSRSVARVAALGLIVVLQRAVAPAMQWFDTKQQFGRLRTR